MKPVDLSNNQIKITDDDWTTDYLQGKGFDIEHDSKLKSQVLAILKPRSVKLKDNELVVITDNRKAVEAKDKLKEQIREFDLRLKLDRDKLNLDKEKAKKDAELKLKQINKPKTTTK